jgi:SAM-dependent methyltransferase
MTHEPAPDAAPADATSIWDRRYEAGDHVGAKPVMEGDPVDYTQHKFLYQRSIAQPLTGALDGYSVEHVARRFMVPAAKRVLAIGSGMAFVEEFLVEQGFAEHILAYEMSRSAIEAARQRVADKPYADRLELRSGDVLHESLPDAAFDVVFVQAAIHHFDRIEEMYELMHRVLRPGGLLIFDEYVGPDHHMYEPEVLAIMDRIDECLAPQYRWDHLARHQRQHVPKPNLEWMLQHDPSEGVHASRILPLTYQWFDVVHRADYGGSIMRPFFTGILPNFDWNDPKDQTVARLVILMEQLLTSHGAIPHYNTSVVARRRDVPRPPLTASESAHINYTGWQDRGSPEPGAMLLATEVALRTASPKLADVPATVEAALPAEPAPAPAAPRRHPLVQAARSRVGRMLRAVGLRR